MKLGTKFILILIISFAVLYYMSIVNLNGFIQGTELSFGEMLNINSVTIISNSIVIVDSNGILYCLGSAENNQIEAVLVAAKLIDVDVRQVTIFPIIIGLIIIFIVMRIKPKLKKDQVNINNDNPDGDQVVSQQSGLSLGGFLKIIFVIIFVFIMVFAIGSMSSDNDNSLDDSYTEVDKTLTDDHYLLVYDDILLGIEIQFTTKVEIDNVTILIEFLDSNKNVVSDDEICLINLDENVTKGYEVTYDLLDAFYVKSYRIIITGEIK